MMPNMLIPNVEAALLNPNGDADAPTDDFFNDNQFPVVSLF
jgi:hypothetical protein